MTLFGLIILAIAVAYLLQALMIGFAVWTRHYTHKSHPLSTRLQPICRPKAKALHRRSKPQLTTH